MKIDNQNPEVTGTKAANPFQDIANLVVRERQAIRVHNVAQSAMQSHADMQAFLDHVNKG